MMISCRDSILEIIPKDQLTDASVWKSPENAGLFLNDIYNSLNPGPISSIRTNVPSEISNDPFDNYSDIVLVVILQGFPHMKFLHRVHTDLLYPFSMIIGKLCMRILENAIF